MMNAVGSSCVSREAKKVSILRYASGFIAAGSLVGGKVVGDEKRATLATERSSPEGCVPEGCRRRPVSSVVPFR